MLILTLDRSGEGGDSKRDVKRRPVEVRQDAGVLAPVILQPHRQVEVHPGLEEGLEIAPRRRTDDLDLAPAGAEQDLPKALISTIPL